MLDNFIQFNLSFSFSLKYILQCDNTRVLLPKNSHNIDESKNPSLSTLHPSFKHNPVLSQNNNCFQFGV